MRIRMEIVRCSNPAPLLGRIRRFVGSHRRPFIAKIYRDGRIEALDLSS